MSMTDAPSVLEKTASETYVPPAVPSLIGLSRAELADKTLELATLLLEAVNNGNFEYERGNVSDNAAE